MHYQDEDYFNFFLSYSRDANIEIIEKIISELEPFGISIWRDKEEVILGNDIYVDLYKTLDAAKKWSGILLIFDKTFFNKTWCMMELDYALKNNITLYPILLFLSKQDIPENYNNIRKLNLCSIRTISDVEYAKYKILFKFLSQYLIELKNTDKLSSPILNNLVVSYNENNKNSSDIIFNCDNIATCIKYLLNNNGSFFNNNEQIIYNIIHNLVKKYYVSGDINKYQIKLITKATDCLIYRYFNRNS